MQPNIILKVPAVASHEYYMQMQTPGESLSNMDVISLLFIWENIYKLVIVT